MEPIKYLANNFFALLQIQPKQTFYTSSLWLADSVVWIDRKDKIQKGEDVSLNDTYLKELGFISENTHELLKIPIAVSEAVVASTPMDKWRTPYDKKNIDGELIKIEGKETTILDIYRLLKESYRTSLRAVVDIVKDYSMEYRHTGNLDNEAPDWMGGEQI
jgi:hypothetical protein